MPAVSLCKYDTMFFNRVVICCKKCQPGCVGQGNHLKLIK